jgi:hypothetical protein
MASGGMRDDRGAQAQQQQGEEEAGENEDIQLDEARSDQARSASFKRSGTGDQEDSRHKKARSAASAAHECTAASEHSSLSSLPASMSVEEPMPQELCCPVTHSMMEDPVQTIDGQAYDRQSIEEWFRRGNTTSPMTNAVLLRDGKVDQTLTPHTSLRRSIHERMNKQLQSLKMQRCQPTSEAHTVKIEDFIPYLRSACATGNLEMLKSLSETCGKELLLMCDTFDGSSCLYTACRQENLEMVKYLCEVGGKELLMLCDTNG